MNYSFSYYFDDYLQLLHCLHSLNITLSDRSKSYYLESIGKQSNASLVQAVREGRDVKVTVDNIDGRMIANQASNMQ